MSRVVLPSSRSLVVSLAAVTATVATGCAASSRPETSAPASAEPDVDEPVATAPTVVAASSDTAHAHVAHEPAAGAVAVVEPAPPPEPPRPLEPAGAVLSERYHLRNAKQTLVGDRGDGYDELYGTRNVRAVLNGIFYRGGANNAFHREGKRSNKNPLPQDGLDNLCRQGFGTAVYLYPTNYDDVPHELTCQTVDGHEGKLTYAQITSQHYHRSDQRVLFGMILDAIRDPSHGAVYAHCWNGWHASGFVSAIALRQFCDFTPAQALRYWTVTAKGASNADHDDTKKRIEKFKPFPEFTLSAEEKARVCPDPKTLAFPAPEAAPAP